MPLSRLLHRGMKKHTPAAICERLDISYEHAHRSTPDAEMAAAANFAMRRSRHDRWNREFAGASAATGPPGQGA